MIDHITKLSQEEFRAIFSDEFVDLMNSYISFWELPSFVNLMFYDNMQFLSVFDIGEDFYSVEFAEFTINGNTSNRPYNNHNKMKIFRSDNPFKNSDGIPHGQFHFQEPYVRIP